MKENCRVNGGRGFLFSSSLLWSGSISFSLKSRRKTSSIFLSLSLSPCLVSRWGDERKVSTAEYLKLWKVVNLVVFFLSVAVSFDTPTPTEASSSSSSSTDGRRLRANVTAIPELKRSFVKKVSTIYSAFFPSFSNWDSFRLVSSGEMDNQRFMRSQLNRAYSEI